MPIPPAFRLSIPEIRESNNLHWSSAGRLCLSRPGRSVHPRRWPARWLLVSSRHRGNSDDGHAAGGCWIGGATQVDLAFDLAEVLQGISLHAGNGMESTHSAPGDGLALRLKSNVERAFTLELAHPVAAAPSMPPEVKPTAIPRGAHACAFVTPPGSPSPSCSLITRSPWKVSRLARVSFFDCRRSGNNTQSCASCHRPEAAFSDAGHAFSKGIDGRNGTRRTMPLFNLAWSAPYTWDGRRERLRDQAFAPIVNPLEMHSTLTEVVRKLRRDRDEPARFDRAFGSPGITPERIGLAMEQYLLTLIQPTRSSTAPCSGKRSSP